jgi:hypothetical protein
VASGKQSWIATVTDSSQFFVMGKKVWKKVSGLFSPRMEIALHTPTKKVSGLFPSVSSSGCETGCPADRRHAKLSGDDGFPEAWYMSLAHS